MSAEGATGRDDVRISMDRHATTYRTEFESLTDDLHGKCPFAWNDTHGGHWYASGNQEVLDLARRADLLSNDSDPKGERRGYQGITIPSPPNKRTRGGFLEMDPPEQQDYRKALNPYLSPAAVRRWQPVLDELTRACIDEHIETGSIDFVDDLANIVPAVFTMALLGFPLADWTVYCEPAHASVYTPPDSPDRERVMEISRQMARRMLESALEIKASPRPGLVNALVNADIGGRPPSDEDLMGALQLLIGGGFDTTTALTAHSLEWLAHNPSERTRLAGDQGTLLDSATEEFLRFFTPAQGDGRTVCRSAVVGGVALEEGDRLWLSWAMANRDPSVFSDPHSVQLDRTGNRHSSFGLGVHRCIGSNVARSAFKTMVRHVLERIPDYDCDPADAVHYDTTGIINGMRKLPATFTPDVRRGPGLEETIAAVQRACDEQGLARPVSEFKGTAVVTY
ncbi:MAG: cytochrome P450 [Nocardioides sp.]|nr:cytochrome P450 [Nocardioides sp.]